MVEAPRLWDWRAKSGQRRDGAKSGWRDFGRAKMHNAVSGVAHYARRMTKLPETDSRSDCELAARAIKSQHHGITSDSAPSADLTNILPADHRATYERGRCWIACFDHDSFDAIQATLPKR